jgi:hypothetical protein
VSLISNKKCPICNSTFPDKVIFCSVCGTELIEATKKPSTSVESPIDLPSGHPNNKTFFRDEPLDTKPIDGDFVTDRTQYAWQVSENLVPFRMKNQISYCDGFKSPKINLKNLRELSFLEGGILSSINLILSVLMVLFTSIVLLTTLQVVTSNSVTIFLGLFSALLCFGLSYFSCFKTAQTISMWDEQPIKMTKSNFFSYSFIHAIHMGLISAISVVCMRLFFPSSDPLSSPITIYAPSIVVILIVALISPTFRIAKILSLLRNAGITQDFLDAIQFPKIGAKRTLQVIVLSYLIPSLLIVAIFSPASKIVSILLFSTTEVNIAVWEYILVSFVIVILALSLTFSNFVDVNTFHYYEQSMKKFVEPPSLNWVKNAYSNTSLQNEDQSERIAFNNTGPDLRDERCPACSAILVTGAEFCTHCGKKVIK